MKKKRNLNQEVKKEGKSKNWELYYLIAVGVVEIIIQYSLLFTGHYDIKMIVLIMVLGFIVAFIPAVVAGQKASEAIAKLEDNLTTIPLPVQLADSENKNKK